MPAASEHRGRKNKARLTLLCLSNRREGNLGSSSTDPAAIDSISASRWKKQDLILFIGFSLHPLLLLLRPAAPGKKRGKKGRIESAGRIEFELQFVFARAKAEINGAREARFQISHVLIFQDKSQQKTVTV